MLCDLCPNRCGIDRSSKFGRCGVGEKPIIAKYYLHKFEEPCISGANGSGTVFFCGCSLRCVFCQNYELSRVKRGKEISVNELADIMKTLETSGATNVNLVTPTHYVHKIKEAVEIYKPNVPIVYNTHGYETEYSLNTANSFSDVYLPDLKFYSPDVSERYTGKRDYFKIASNAIKFMAKKPLVFDENGIMKSGTLVRHLVLPSNVSDSKNVIDFLSDFKDKIFLNVMSQYTPFGEIKNFPELNRKVTKREYDTVIDYAIGKGFSSMYWQKRTSASEIFIPSWDY